MGKTITPTYYARYRDQAGWHDIMWNGRATDTKAEQMRRSLNTSFAHGGVNYGIPEMHGYIVHVSKVEIIRNDGRGRVVARANAPMFEVA